MVGGAIGIVIGIITLLGNEALRDECVATTTMNRNGRNYMRVERRVVS